MGGLPQSTTTAYGGALTTFLHARVTRRRYMHRNACARVLDALKRSSGPGPTGAAEVCGNGSARLQSAGKFEPRVGGAGFGRKRMGGGNGRVTSVHGRSLGGGRHGILTTEPGACCRTGL